MVDFLITYNNGKTVIITDISADRARNTLKSSISNVIVINSTIKLSKKSKTNLAPTK